MAFVILQMVRKHYRISQHECMICHTSASHHLGEAVIIPDQHRGNSSNTKIINSRIDETNENIHIQKCGWGAAEERHATIMLHISKASDPRDSSFYSHEHFNSIISPIGILLLSWCRARKLLSRYVLLGHHINKTIERPRSDLSPMAHDSQNMIELTEREANLVVGNGNSSLEIIDPIQNYAERGLPSLNHKPFFIQTWVLITGALMNIGWIFWLAIAYTKPLWQGPDFILDGIFSRYVATAAKFFLPASPEHW